MRNLSALLTFLSLVLINFWPMGGMVYSDSLLPEASPSDQQGVSKARLGQEDISPGKEGFRDRLERAGISIWVSYAADLLGNPSGGRVLAFRYASGLEFGLKFDLERIMNRKDLMLEVSGDYHGGHDLSRDIGNAFAPAQIFSIERRFGDGTLRLYRFSLEKLLLDDRLSLLAGRIGMGDDFLTSELYGNFVQAAFNSNPAGVVVNLPSFSVGPVSTWGWRAKYEGEKWVFTGGIYNSDDSLGDDDKHGVDFSIRSDKGFIPIVQLGYKHNQEKNTTGLPGNYSMAVYYDSNEFEDLGDPSDSRHGNYGLYFHADQMVYAEPGTSLAQGLTSFLATTVMPLTHINKFPYFVMGGMVYKGLFLKRDHDTTSVGVAYGQFSDQLDKTYEITFELTHEFEVTSWLSLQPDVQYILRPGGTGNIPDAWVLGFELELSY